MHDYYSGDWMILYFRFLAIILLSICSGCVLEPLHQDLYNTFLNQFDYNVEYDSTEYSRVNFFFNKELEKLFNIKVQEKPKFLLKIKYVIHKYNSFINHNGIANRKRITIVLYYTIIQNNRHKIINTGKITNTHSVETRAISYLDSTAEEDLIIKVLSLLVQELKIRLIFKTFKEH